MLERFQVFSVKALNVRDEIQDVINEYVDTRDSTKQGGLGFVSNDDEGEFKVNISNDEVNKLPN